MGCVYVNASPGTIATEQAIISTSLNVARKNLRLGFMAILGRLRSLREVDQTKHASVSLCFRMYVGFLHCKSLVGPAILVKNTGGRSVGCRHSALLHRLTW